MSSRARRIARRGPTERFDLGRGAGRRPSPSARRRHRRGRRCRRAGAGRRRRPIWRRIERDAFAKGYAQGERAGAEAGGRRAPTPCCAGWRRRIDELQALRSELIRRTEREVVELALAIAKQVAAARGRRSTASCCSRWRGSRSIGWPTPPPRPSACIPTTTRRRSPARGPSAATDARRADRGRRRGAPRRLPRAVGLRLDRHRHRRADRAN